MAAKKTSKPKAQRATGTEYRFEIDAFTPATIPMARLAEYMAHVATIMGEQASVHFKALEVGSTVLVSQVQKEAVPKVRDRAVAVRRGDAPRDAQVAYRHVNRMLRDDNATGALRDRKRGPIVLPFPGRKEAEESLPTVTEFGTLQGTVNRVGGTGDDIPVILESEGALIVGCHASKQTAKSLARHLFEPVRVYGRGRWLRNADGVWSLKDFKIDKFETLQNDTLSAAVDELRGVGTGWSDTALEELHLLRHGQE